MGKLTATDEYLGVAELAALYGLSESTIYGWRSGGRRYGPPGVKVGRRVKYRRSDVEAWFDKQKKS